MGWGMGIHAKRTGMRTGDCGKVKEAFFGQFIARVQPGWQFSLKFIVNMQARLTRMLPVYNTGNYLGS